MPSDTDPLPELDLGEPPQHLLDWAKENINEDPETRCMVLEEFRDMIFAKGECTPHRTDDAYLLRFLRARKFSVESAHRLLVNYYNFKEDHPEFFEGVNLKTLLRRLAPLDIISVPPYREQTGRRTLLYRMGKWDPERYSITELLQSTLAILEIAILEQRAQILGGIAFFDMTGLSMQQAYQMTPSVAQIIIKIMVTSFPMKIHAVHVVFQPWIFDIVYGMFKPFLNNSMKERIHFHGEDMDSLHQHIDPKHLSYLYGGAHPEYNYDDWIDGFAKSEKIKEEVRSLGYEIDVDDEGYEGYKSDSDKSQSSDKSEK